MTVKRVIFPFTNEKIGGSHISSFALGEVLQKDYGIEVVVAAPAGSLIVKTAAEAGFTLWPLAEKPVARHNPLTEARVFLRRLRQLSKQPERTILHCNDIAAQQSWGPAARLLGIPVIYHNRSLNRDVLPNRLVIALAHRIICISRSVEENLPASLRGRAVRIDNPFEIARPANTDELRRAFFEKWNLRDEGPLVGFIGNFAKRKRPRFFLEMARDLLAEHPLARFVLFGRAVDETEDELRAYAATMGIADRVIFAGFQLPVENNIAILDLLAITALNEPLGRTPIEALLIGTPYITSDDAGLGETCRRFGGGWMVPATASPEEFAREAARLLGAMPTMDFSAEQERARTELSARKHTERVLELYNSVPGA